MDDYLGYVPGRRSPWKAISTKKGVRQAIAYDQGRGCLRLFSRGVLDDRIFFLEIPRDQWGEMFAD